jgi:hypothetical protein
VTRRLRNQLVAGTDAAEGRARARARSSTGPPYESRSHRGGSLGACADAETIVTRLSSRTAGVVTCCQQRYEQDSHRRPKQIRSQWQTRQKKRLATVPVASDCAGTSRFTTSMAPGPNMPRSFLERTGAQAEAKLAFRSSRWTWARGPQPPPPMPPPSLPPTTPLHQDSQPTGN